MRRNMSGDILLNLIYRTVLALVLTAVGVCLSLTTSSPAQASTATMCSNTAVPTGWAVTHVYRGQPRCGGYLLYEITNSLYDSIRVCSAAPVPTGWVATRVASGDPTCGGYLLYTLHLPYNSIQMCSVTAVPAGWIVIYTASGDPACAGYLRYTLKQLA